MTKQQAKKLCIRKWEWIVKYWDYKKNDYLNKILMIKSTPSIEYLDSQCAYCEKYIKYIDYRDYKDLTFHRKCEKCPLYKIKWCCLDSDSIYCKWCICVVDNKNGTKYAKQMLEAIKRS